MRDSYFFLNKTTSKLFAFSVFAKPCLLLCKTILNALATSRIVLLLVCSHQVVALSSLA